MVFKIRTLSNDSVRVLRSQKIEAPPSNRKTHLNKNPSHLNAQTNKLNDWQQAPIDTKKSQCVQIPATVSSNVARRLRNVRTTGNVEGNADKSNGAHLKENKAALMEVDSSSSKKSAIENEKKGKLAY